MRNPLVCHEQLGVLLCVTRRFAVSNSAFCCEQHFMTQKRTGKVEGSQLFRLCVMIPSLIGGLLLNQLLYSCQDLILMSSNFSAVKASMKAFARRTLVISGMLWSMAPRRIL